MQMLQCRCAPLLLPSVTLVVLLSLVAHVGGAQISSQLSMSESTSLTPWNSVFHHFIFSRIGLAPSSNIGSHEDMNWTMPKRGQNKHAVPLEFGTQSEQYLHKVPSNGNMFFLTVAGNSRHLLEISGEAGNVINVVAQLMENRYNPNVSPTNCHGLLVNVEIRKKNADLTSPYSEDEGDMLPQVSERTDASTPWSLFWNAMATILDSSAFCELLPTVMMRVQPTQVPTSYYFVITSRRAVDASFGGHSCYMRVFIDQSPEVVEGWMQNVFALAIPLLFLLITLPCILWRIDLIPVYLSDIDVIGWLWCPSYVLRDTVILMITSSYSFLWGLYTEQRARRRQRRLEELHSRLMENTTDQQFTPQPLQRQPQETCDGAVPVTCEGIAAKENGGNCGDVCAHNMSVIHVHSSPSAAPREGEEVANFVAKRLDTREEKQKLLGSQSTNEDRDGPALRASDVQCCTKEEGGREEAAPTGLCETAAPCVVHVRTSVAEVQKDELREFPTGHEDGEKSGGGHWKEGSGEHCVVLKRTGAGGDEDEEERICRICRDGEEDEKLVSVCECIGSVRWVHRTCLDHWRMESAKRNVRNMSRCEICREPFHISIRRRTLLWQSSQHILKTFVLLVCMVAVAACIVMTTHSTFGEISCRAPWRSVSYRTMFSLDGLFLSFSVYFMLTLLAAFAFASVYGRWHVREDTMAHVREFHELPEFWTRRRAMQVVAVYVIGLLQALCFGYLAKLVIYRTSSVVWNWEASPSVGGVLFLIFISASVGVVREVRELIQNRTGRGLQDVVVEVHPSEPQQQSAAADTEEQPRGAEETPEAPHTGVLPPHLRPIRAMEYAPPRPIARQS